MNGVTGRMGLNQHLRRSILRHHAAGRGSPERSEYIMPRPLLVGRNAAKLEAISKECGGLPWTTDRRRGARRSAVLGLLRCADDRPSRRMP